MMERMTSISPRDRTHLDEQDAGPRPATPPPSDLREIVMGSQDNLTNVLAVVLGVAIGSGKAATVALAGLAAGLAEAISMAGVLYTATRAERDLELLRRRASGDPAAVDGTSGPRPNQRPLRAGAVTFAAGIVAAVVPLAPFAVLPLVWACVASIVVSLAALFALGGWKGALTGRSWWRDGLQLLAIGGVAALAAAVLGTLLKVAP